MNKPSSGILSSLHNFWEDEISRMTKIQPAQSKQILKESTEILEDWEDPAVTSRNKEPARASYCPYGTPEEAARFNRAVEEINRRRSLREKGTGPMPMPQPMSPPMSQPGPRPN